MRSRLFPTSAPEPATGIKIRQEMSDQQIWRQMTGKNRRFGRPAVVQKVYPMHTKAISKQNQKGARKVIKSTATYIQSAKIDISNA
jgi:hypothetical protein